MNHETERSSAEEFASPPLSDWKPGLNRTARPPPFRLNGVGADNRKTERMPAASRGDRLTFVQENVNREMKTPEDRRTCKRGDSYDGHPPNLPSVNKTKQEKCRDVTPKVGSGVKKTPLHRRPPSVDRLRASSGPGFMCRICHEDDALEDLISPCYCSGTMGLIHRSCMQKWLNASNSTSCELCKCSIQLRARRKSPWEWFSWQLEEWALERDRHRRGPGDMDSDGRHLLGDAICFFFLTPMALTSAGLCAESAIAKRNEPWESAGLVLLTVFLTAIYCIWMALAIRFHITQFRTWQEAHLELFIAATPYPARGSRVRSRFFPGKRLRVNKDASPAEEEGFLRPLPSVDATPNWRGSYVGPTHTASLVFPEMDLEDSVFVVPVDLVTSTVKSRPSDIPGNSGEGASGKEKKHRSSRDVLSQFGVVIEDGRPSTPTVDGIETPGKAKPEKTVSPIPAERRRSTPRRGRFTVCDLGVSEDTEVNHDSDNNNNPLNATFNKPNVEIYRGIEREQSRNKAAPRLGREKAQPSRMPDSGSRQKLSPQAPTIHHIRRQNQVEILVKSNEAVSCSSNGVSKNIDESRDQEGATNAEMAVDVGSLVARRRLVHAELHTRVKVVDGSTETNLSPTENPKDLNVIDAAKSASVKHSVVQTNV